MTGLAFSSLNDCVVAPLASPVIGPLIVRQEGTR